MCRQNYTLVIRSSNKLYGTTTDYTVDVGRFFQGLPEAMRSNEYINGQLVAYVFPDSDGDTNTNDFSLDIKTGLVQPFYTDTDKRSLQSTAILVNNNEGADGIHPTTVPHQFTCTIPDGNLLRIRIENAVTGAEGEDIEEHVLVYNFNPIDK